MKIFVTGDNHIGMKYAGHEAGDMFVEERMNALSRMVDKANEEHCDLFAVTGDLFESISGIPKKTVKKVAETLWNFNGNVAVLPGNHDFYDDNTQVWQDFINLIRDKDNNNIRLLNEYRPYLFDDIDTVIYPAFCDKKHSEPNENKLDRIKNEDMSDSGKFHIGIAHGTVEGEALDKEGAYFVMTRDELNDIPVDVWLMGHVHVPFPGDLTEKFQPRGEKIFNPGTHVQINVNNNTEGFCFIIDIDRQKHIRAKKYISGDLRFYRREVNVTAGNMVNELKAATADIGKKSYVELILSGAVSDDEYNNRDKTLKEMFKDCLEFSYTDDHLTCHITEDMIKKEFPATSLAARLLTALVNDPEEEQLVYDLINSIKEGK